jgi:hypothetical protein
MDARKPMVEVIQAGLAEFGDAWATLAPLVATGELAAEDADDIVHESLRGVISSAIAQAMWPGVLDRDEVAALHTICRWLADEVDPPPFRDNIEGDDDAA